MVQQICNNNQIPRPEELRRRQIRQAREMRDAYDDWIWRRWHDDADIFDLRYLFDHEEIREERQRLIEDIEIYAQNPQYYRFMLYDNNVEEDQPMPAYEDDDDVEMYPLPDENWDDANYNVRFDMRQGFYLQYDSGIEMSDDEEENEIPDIDLEW